MSRVIILLTVCLSFLLLANFSIADECAEVKHEYIGAKKCKMCHKKDGIHPSWAETKHAKAWELLDSAAQKKEDCVKCHSTGTTAKGVLLEGVQCEACHGPGSDYKKKSIMEDREKAVANGLIIPNEKTCLACHENVPEEFRAKEKFDFEKMKTTGVHAMIEKKEKKE